MGNREAVDPVKFWRDCSRSLRERGKMPTFFVVNTIRTRLVTWLATFALPISAKLGRNIYMNPCAGGSFCNKMVDILPSRGRFSAKTDFSVASVNFGVNNLLYDAEKRSPSKGTSSACPLSKSNSISPIVRTENVSVSAVAPALRIPRALQLCRSGHARAGLNRCA